jgi:uncharacterized protein YjiS (DUF1127 family)
MSSGTVSRPLSGLGSGLAHFSRRLGQLFVTIELAMQVRKERLDLQGLDERMLKDVGYNRSHVHAEGERAFWDVPVDRMRT